MSRFIDMAGQKFNRLTVIKRHPVDYIKPSDGNRAARWIVLCDCGKYKVIIGEAIRAGKTKSCGCLQKERIVETCFVDLTGRIFGLWSVVGLSPTKNNSNQLVWDCVCTCGRTNKITTGSLRSGSSTRCKRCANKTHGLSRTKPYVAVMNLVRYQNMRMLDTKWTHAMDKLLRELQPNCVICNRVSETTDHVLPLSKGYGLIPGNAVRLCQDCNRRKGPKLLSDLPEVWRHRLTMAAEQFRCAWAAQAEVNNP